jgi:hypothetical protein
VLAPGGGLRGSPAGAYRLHGMGHFATGWVVVRGGSAVFAARGFRGRVSLIDLGSLTSERVSDTGFFRRVDLRSEGGTGQCLFFSVNGPSEESLRAEFLFS